MKRSSWLKNLWPTARPQSARSVKRRSVDARLGNNHDAVETLDARSLLSVTALFIPVNGELNIQCDASDSVRVTATAQGNVLVEKAAAGGTFVPATSIGNVRAASVRSIVVLGGDDQNTIDLSGVTSAAFTAKPRIQVDGANGHDTIIGSPDCPDSLSGGDGDDTIDGAGGNDTLLGGDGNDSITAGDGADAIRGGNGADTITGDLGADTIDAGDGNDTVSGGEDNDNIFAGNGQDLVTGDLGNDTLNGDGGVDTVSGNEGNDSILGGDLNDSLSGGDGNDTLNGQGGNDSITGEVGDDSLEGAAGNDSLTGGDGADFFNCGLGNDSALGNSGNDTILGGAGDDRLLGDGTDAGSPEIGNDSISGQGGQDTIIGGQGRDILNGGDGHDSVSSSFTTAELPPAPPVPVQPPTPPGPPNPVSANFGPAVSTGAGTPVIGNVTRLVRGAGDTSLQIDVAATGDFGFGFGFSTIAWDPIGPTPAGNPNFDESHQVAVNANVLSDIQTGATVQSFTASLTEANSTFTRDGLNYVLVQTVAPLLATNGTTIGSVLAQTYTVTNPGAQQVQLRFAREEHWHMDSSFGTFTGGDDGGGRIVLNGGTEILMATSEAGPPTLAVDFVGVTGIGGNMSPPNRFEFGNFPSPFIPLTDTILNDFNGDGFTEVDGHYGQGLRNLFTVGSGQSVTYTTHTIFGSAAPNQIADTPPNVPPVAVPDTATTIGGIPVTFDVVSNDTDSDGVVIFDTVNIETQPAIGTLVNEGNGLLTYSPPVTFSGTVTFTYSIEDNSGVRSLPATVTISVTPADQIGDSLIGGDGNDTLTGNLGNDTLNGAGGNDVLRGRDGFDLIFGGSGADTLLGEAGNDTLDGQGGADSLDGGDGEDLYMWAGAASGFDTLFGSEGSDTASIQGSGLADAIVVGEVDGLMTVTFGGATLTLSDSEERPSTIVNVVVNGLGGNDTLTLGNVNNVGRLQLVLNGGEGNDLLDAFGSRIGAVRVAMNGNAGNDTINGSLGADTLNGGAGDDSCCGFAGNDTMLGEAGNDSLGGSLGNDLINGGDGNDLLNGQLGDDSVLGGIGEDTLKGEEGNDTLLGELGNDNLNGAAGNDSLEGSSGTDALVGGAGNDTLSGGRNDDTISGNAGDDKIRGDHGHDYIAAGDGSDTINGGDGNDTIVTLDGNDFVHGGDGDDRINTAGGNDVIAGGDGNDSIQGGGGQDTIVGGDGDDSINGQGGTDVIAGQQGLDVLDDPLSEINEKFVLDSVTLQILRAL